MPQLFLGFHLSCASGYLPSLSFYGLTYLHIYSMWSLGVLLSIISLRFFIRALVGDDIFGFSVSWIVLLCSMQCEDGWHKEIGK